MNTPSLRIQSSLKSEPLSLGTGTPGFIRTRRFACACDACMTGEEEACTGEDWCGPWEMHEIRAMTEVGAMHTRGLERMRIDALVEEGHVALQAGDNVSVVGVGEDRFHIMKVVKAPFVLMEAFEHEALVHHEFGLGWRNGAVDDEDEDGPWTDFWPDDEVFIGVWYQPIRGGAWGLCDEEWASKSGAVKGGKWDGFPYVVCKTNIIRHWGFTLMPESQQKRQSHKRRAADGKSYILGQEEEDAIDASLGLG